MRTLKRVINHLVLAAIVALAYASYSYANPGYLAAISSMSSGYTVTVMTGQTVQLDGAADLVYSSAQPTAGSYTPYVETLGGELLPEGDCSADVFEKGTGWSYDAVNLEYDCDGTQSAESDLTYTVGSTLLAGELLRVQFTVKNYVAGQLRVWRPRDQPYFTPTDGTFVFYGAQNGSVYFILRADANFVGSVTDISIKRVVSRSRIDIYDPAHGATWSGWIGAASDAYSYTGNVPELASLDLTSGWDYWSENISISDADSYSTTNSIRVFIKRPIAVGYGLFKTTFDASITAGTVRVAGNASAPIFASNGESDIYKTALSTSFFIDSFSGPAVIDINTIEMLRVIAPDTTGVFIYDGEFSATRGWASQVTDFDPNRTNLTVTIYQR